jgi:hypothetical protein
MNFLKNLQNKPDHVKQTVMWFGVFLIMFLIFSIWVLTFPSQIPAREAPGIWNSLKTQFNALW